MTKTELKEALRGERIFNNHGMLKEFGGPEDVAVEYHRSEWRDVRPNMTKVWSPREHPDLDPPEVLSDTWAKKFTGNKAESFGVALSFCETELGLEMATSPFGGAISASVVEAAKKFIEGLTEEERIT